MNEILDTLGKLKDILDIVPCNMAENLCNSIEQAYKDDKFYLGVVGEFKRGKSTMINSLIGQDLLPSDILPTTATINILEYSENEYADIYWNDGIVEALELSKDNLFRFTAESEQETDNIEFIKIGLNCDILKTGMVIIDTPGVNDISKSRVEVTKNILPNCDSIIFLLDAAAPLTRSEAEFLETKILRYKLNSLMFIISKADRLKEEELEESIEGAEERIKQVIDFNVNLMAYSSREVMKSESLGNENVYKKNLLKYIEELRIKSEEEKNFRQKEKLKLIVDLIRDEIITQESINKLNIQSLNKTKEKVELMIKNDEVKFNQLMLSSEFVGRKTLHEMFDKSLDKLNLNMINEFRDNLRIDSNVENYWNRTLPIQVERNLRKYSEDKSKEIYTYINKITQHIIQEYNKNFQVPLLLQLKADGINIPDWKLEQNNFSNVAPMMYRVVPITLGAIIGSLFMPGIGTALGSAGGQILSATFKENKNNELREKLIESLPQFLESTLREYRQCVHTTIDESFDKLFNNITIMHTENTNENLNKFNSENKNSNSQNILGEKEKLTKLKKDLIKLKQNIEGIIV